MKNRSRASAELFALPAPPPARLLVRGQPYELERVFKHDFFAATALYRLQGEGGELARLVVKFGRTQSYCGLPTEWIGRLLRRREERFHRRADGVPGIQRWHAKISDTAYALEYVAGQTLDTLAKNPPPGAFFDSLRVTLDRLHARGVAYCDLNKRSNIVVTESGQPGLIDFQISVVHNPDALWPWEPVSYWIVRYLQRMDLYHLYKHKRRLAKAELRPEELLLSRRPGVLTALHRRLVTPLRHLRRALLARLHRTGRLVSPSAELEDHWQPEKATWRK